MSDVPHEPAGPAPVSRRETLRRAAGALALSVGLPASALAADADEADALKLLFYRGDDERPFYQAEVDEEAAEVLLDERSLIRIKFEDGSGEREDLAMVYGKITWHQDRERDR